MSGDAKTRGGKAEGRGRRLVAAAGFCNSRFQQIIWTSKTATLNKFSPGLQYPIFLCYCMLPTKGVYSGVLSQ